ncbi:transposase [candidate division CSSED10-310 bacterium]|uniref:Mutator family transposase n=1 Tax=candidate division CSSED10-310 bacterium TaxID=2855610 RepID=A0ABV6Z2E1_UNCC1
MVDNTKNDHSSPESPGPVLKEIFREGARQMLQEAILQEVADNLEKNKATEDEKGLSLAVRNGYLPEREILTGLGSIKVKQPRVDDRKLRKTNEEEGFSSQILPPYMRRIPSIDNLVSALYLRGISSGDFPRALSAILGPNADNLSATTVVRLKATWKQEYEQWCQQDLSEKEYVYLWADGIYFNVRLEAERTCKLFFFARREVHSFFFKNQSFSTFN